MPRVALYYAPLLDDPLWRAGASWLGRCPETNAPVPHPALPGIAEVTAAPRMYGFHATLKPPMRLPPGRDWDALVLAVHAIADGIPPFNLPPLSVQDLDGFLALRETEPSVALQALADACVAGVDEFRAPLGNDELARRRRHGLTPAQDANLLRWGYPHVFATWFFHMTLTRRLDEAEKPGWRAAAEAHFAGMLAVPRRVTDICLFTQAPGGAPFTVAKRVPLRG